MEEGVSKALLSSGAALLILAEHLHQQIQGFRVDPPVDRRCKIDGQLFVSLKDLGRVFALEEISAGEEDMQYYSR